MADDNSTPSNESRESVGALLKSHREKSGKEITIVASSLRISARYLEAIEDGRYEDLPGNTYAVGFIRSYSEHLGLDEDEIVRRFKEEVDEFSPKTDLIFPKPIPEGGVPGGVLLLGGALFALLAYGIWYISSSDEQVASSVEAVPQRIVEETQNINNVSPQEGSKVFVDDKVSSTTKPEEQITAPDASAIKEETAPDVVQEKLEKETVNQQTVDAAVPVAAPSEQPAAEQPAAEQPEPDVQPDSETTAQTQQAETALPAVVSEPAPQPAVKKPVADTSVSSRITVRAKTNSWIQVRDEAEDKLMFTRLLRKGNEYNVPDRSGLTLLTGNAGALEILVDGELAPAIGETGQVRRNVSLDPEQLKSGTAVKD